MMMTQESRLEKKMRKIGRILAFFQKMAVEINTVAN